MTFPLINIRFILLISASFIAIFSAIAIYFCLPLLISHVIRSQITLSINSGSYNDWRLNSVIDRIYLFNITNLNLNDATSENINKQQAGGSEPSKTQTKRPSIKLKQIGPFTFRQDREKLNIRFDTNNETVLYDQKKSWTFLPELSVVKSFKELNSTWLNHINVPLAGTTLNPEYSDFIDPIVTEHDLRLFLNHSINSILFEGYYDVLMENAKASGQTEFDRFGWMYSQNNSITKSIRIFTGTSNETLNKFGSIDEYQYKKRFSIWHNNGSKPTDFADVLCNEYRYSSAGEFFPPSDYSIISYNRPHSHTPDALVESHVDAKQLNQSTAHDNDDELAISLSSSTAMDRHLSLVESESIVVDSSDKKLQKLEQKLYQTISIFMPDLCRTIKLYYNGSYHYKGLLVDRYVANELTYSYSDGSENVAAGKQRQLEENKCFCIYNENTRSLSCPPNGMMDLYSCQKGSPVTISFPHFLYSTGDKTLSPYLNLFEYDDSMPRTTPTTADDYQFFVDLESSLNVPIKVQIVLQFNVHLRNDASFQFMKEYQHLFDDHLHSSAGNSNKSSLKDLYLPQMWIQSTGGIDDKNLNNLKFIQKHLYLVTPITAITIFAFASILLLAAAKLAYDLTYGPKSMSCDQESCSSLNRTYQCPYLDEKKKKYLDMQLLGANEKSLAAHQNVQGCCKPGDNNNNNLHHNHVDRPTTSRMATDFELMAGQEESQPLNR